MTSPADVQKMKDALHLPDALDKLTNSDRAREEEAARQNPPPAADEDLDGEKD